MANLRTVLQDQEARRLVDEDPDQHSHPLFRQSPGRKMQGARGREGIKRNRTTEREIPRKWRRNPKNQPSNRPKGRKRTEGDRRGSRAQGPGTKTEAGNRLGEQDRARPDLHRHHKPGRRERGPKEPQSRSRSHARASPTSPSVRVPQNRTRQKRGQ